MDGFARSLTAFNARLKELFRARHTQSNRLNYFLCVFPTCAVCLCCLFRELCSVSWLRLLLNVTTLGRSKWQLSRKKGGFLLSLCQQRAATNKLACWLLRVFSDTSSESHKGFFLDFSNVLPWPSRAHCPKRSPLLLLLLRLLLGAVSFCCRWWQFVFACFR